MSNNLDAQKEEEVKALLKTDSVRKIVKKTGVAKNTISRIRNENLTEEERTKFKRLANVKGRNKRKLRKVGQNIPKNISSNKSTGIPSGQPPYEIPIAIEKPENSVECPFCHVNAYSIEQTSEEQFWLMCQCGVTGPVGKTKEEAIKRWNDGSRSLVIAKPIGPTSLPQKTGLLEGDPKYNNFLISQNLTFPDLAHKYMEHLDKMDDELTAEIKRLIKQLSQIRYQRPMLDEFLTAFEQGKELSEQDAFREYLELESDILESESRMGGEDEGPQNQGAELP